MDLFLFLTTSSLHPAFRSYTFLSLRAQNAGAEQRLPRGGVRGGRSGEELPGSALREGHIQGHLHPHRGGHLSPGDQLR